MHFGQTESRFSSCHFTTTCLSRQFYDWILSRHWQQWSLWITCVGDAQTSKRSTKMLAVGISAATLLRSAWEQNLSLSPVRNSIGLLRDRRGSSCNAIFTRKPRERGSLRVHVRENKDMIGFRTSAEIWERLTCWLAEEMPLVQFIWRDWRSCKTIWQYMSSLKLQSFACQNTSGYMAGVEYNRGFPSLLAMERPDDN